jgi:hypothetical protein
MKSSTKGTRILQAYSGASMHLLSFSTRNAIAKLAQVYGLSKKGRIRLEVLDFALAPTLWPSPVKDRHSLEPPFGGRKSSTPRNLQSPEG